MYIFDNEGNLKCARTVIYKMSTKLTEFVKTQLNFLNGKKSETN